MAKANQKVNPSGKENPDHQGFYLCVDKAVFCSGLDLLRRMTPANDEYQSTKSADIEGSGPMLVEYTIRKCNTQNEKGCSKVVYLGRVLQFNDNGFVVFPKKRNDAVLFKKPSGETISYCKADVSDKKLYFRIKEWIEKFYPEYKDYGMSDRIVKPVLLKKFKDIWMGFYKISKRILKRYCGKDETPHLFWEYGENVLLWNQDIDLFSNRNCGLCWIKSTAYHFDYEYLIRQGKMDLFWLHQNIKDKKLQLRSVIDHIDEESLSSEALLSMCGAFEMIYKVPKNYLNTL